MALIVENINNDTMKNYDLRFTNEPWFLRLWHGYYSLPVAFWLFGFIGNVIFSIIIKILTFIQYTLSISIITWIILLSIILFIYIIYSIIALTGIYRSTKHYYGRKVWRIVADIIVALGWLSLLGELAKLLKGILNS